MAPTSPQDLDAQLAALRLFAGLSKRQRAKLLDKSKIIDHQAGREVAEEGKGGLALHLITSGRATVTVNGRQVRELGAGDYFGEISLIDGKPRSATVTASEPLQTLAVPHLAFRSLIEDDPGAAQALLVVLCARLREVEGSGA